MFVYYMKTDRMIQQFGTVWGAVGREAGLSKLHWFNPGLGG